MKKKIVWLLLVSLCLWNFSIANATQLGAVNQNKPATYKANAQTINYAFVFDGKSDKNIAVMKQFQQAIIKSTAPDFKAVFPENLVFVGDWSENGAKLASDKALASNASMVVSLGYFSSNYLSAKKDKKKFVVTIDQYGLRDFGNTIFNPAQQFAKGVVLLQKLTHFQKASVLVNENYFKTRKDWDSFLAGKIPNTEFKVIPVGNNVNAVLSKMPADTDAVVFTALFNISNEEKQTLINNFNSKKIPTFSTVGKEDVEMGVLLGTSALDVDKRLADATSFNIKGALQGEVKKSSKIDYYEDEIIYMNQDTADLIGYQPHLRVLNNAEIITKKQPVVYDLSAIFDKLETQNLDIERKKLLVKAARRASYSAMLKYLPTFGVTLGYQQYDHGYADSVKLSIPEKTGIFSMGLEQVIYSPALVTNILIKRKGVDFSKAEQRLTEQNMGIEVALLYIETLMLENVIKVQKEYVKESRENLAMARVREKMGFCGKEEALRWASQLNVNEEHLLKMSAEYKNLRIAINKLLFTDQKQDYKLAALTAHDPAFYTSEINIINYVSTPQALDKFTDMLIAEAFRVAPELEKLRAAVKMKNYEMAMYYQKFLLPDAKLTLDYTSLINRQFANPAGFTLPAGSLMPGVPGTNKFLPMGTPDATNGRIGIFAQWRPIEGGTKFAEIARIKAEREELQRYEDEAKSSIEMHIRDTINKALAGYFSIEKNYKSMYASMENYHQVKDMYLRGKAPIAQVLDAQKIYLDSKTSAMNSQYEFFKELVWVQRGICAVNWNKADKDAKMFISNVKSTLEEKSDISL